MLFYFLMMPQLGKGSYGELLPNLGASLVYLHNFIYHAGSVINNNAWSLEVEIQFYILVPVLLTGLRFTSLTRRTTLILFVVLFSINRLWLPVGMPVNLLQYFQYFLIGILLCEIRENHWLGCPKRYRYDILGLVAWPLFFVVNFNCSALTEDVFNPLLIGMFFVSALRGVLHGRVLSWSWIPLVGGMCYSIYLLHARILSLLLHKCFGTLELTGNFTADLSILILVAFPIVIGLSSVFFLLIEKPCMKPNWPSLLLQWFKASRAK
jgi:peptidoglycan/LPS O-acetylase OafA/YrhL